MKYVVFLCDGMADDPVDALGGKTPMEVANKPLMDELCSKGELLSIKTVPDGFEVGSDVANQGILGYDVTKSYHGRSPLEVVSAGIELTDQNVTYRANLVTLSYDDENQKFEDKKMEDYSAGDVTTEDATELIAALNAELECDEYKFYPGFMYRQFLIFNNPDAPNPKFNPPHDISGEVVGKYLPNDELLTYLTKRSYEILHNHPVNLRRIAEGEKPANSIWLWGRGTKSNLANFEEKYGVKGSVISAVDLVRGIAMLSGMENVIVPGATGYIDTNWSGKAQACINELKRGQEFVYIHMEAPDECGHKFEVENKVESIEAIDEQVIKPIYEYLKNCGEDYRILIMPDHKTPLKVGTHTSGDVPLVIYDSRVDKNTNKVYNEANATEKFKGEVHELMEYFIKG
ncbi:MAG: cofactor-independent phosphoglycerate mutase [Clostridiales bacterium]|jgi:2,3-bisphosphoglycerate-independent phosphoglycerate mutase|nr:cofactor-independent phosphoglycerate mutase [Clostridiales bacterium]